MVNPNVTSLLTLINIGLPTSVIGLSHNRERRFLPCMFTNTTTTDSLDNPACGSGGVGRFLIGTNILWHNILTTAALLHSLCGQVGKLEVDLNHKSHCM